MAVFIDITFTNNVERAAVRIGPLWSRERAERLTVRIEEIMQHTKSPGVLSQRVFTCNPSEAGSALAVRYFLVLLLTCYIDYEFAVLRRMNPN